MKLFIFTNIFQCPEAPHSNNEQAIDNESQIITNTRKVQNYSCKECEETFFSENALCVHISKVGCLAPVRREDSYHPCNLCKHRFRYETMLALHCRAMHGIGYHKDCPFCDEHFDISGSVEDFYNHLVGSHNSETESDAFLEIVDELTECKRLCQKCSKTFKSKTNWFQHIRRWHGESDPVACHLCGKTIKLKMDMYLHLKTHIDEGKSICPECGVTLKNNKYLSRHMLTHNKIPFPCELCGKQFFTKLNLQNHVDFVHLKKRPFSCEFCGKDFQTTSKVKSHIRSIHTNEKPYSCEDCDYTCSRSDALKTHRNSLHNK